MRVSVNDTPAFNLTAGSTELDGDPAVREAWTTTDPEHEQLAAALLESLRREGVPQGVWLADIARTREALREADDTLRRLYDAVLQGLPPLEQTG